MRRATTIAVIAIAACAGALTARLLASAPEITVAAAPSPPVLVHVPPIATPSVIVHPAPPPPAAPAPAPPARTPAPRALTPTLDVACQIPPEQGTEVAGSCTWDAGLPAISADGTTIARLWDPPSAGKERHERAVELIEVATARVVGRTLIVSDEELEKVPLDRAALQRTVNARVAGIQRTLDDGRYRTLVDMGEAGGFDGVQSKPRETPPLAPYAEIAYDQVRILDPATATVVARHAFGVVARSPNVGDDEICGGWGLWRVHVAWDPPTRTLLALQTYRTGGCMCPDITVPRVARVR